LEKIGTLSPAEFEKIKRHSNDGFNLLREQKDVNLLSAHVAFQHHERYDGVGYPRLLKKNEICEYARIVAIADIFDALTSENKHRKSFSVPAALEIMKKEAGRQIDQDLVEMFMGNVALYSTGQLVKLNTGEVAVVTANSPGRSSRPKVKILLDHGKKPVEQPKEIDLYNEPSISILKVIEDDAFCANVSKLFGETADGPRVKA
jgi:HD-GYP domain-containing protein (c-di-GMP phosphodiesterase class II)